SLGVKAALPSITSLDDEAIIGAIDSEYESHGKVVLEHDYVREWLRIVTVDEAIEQFSLLVNEALSGKEVVVARGGKPVVRLTAVAPVLPSNPPATPPLKLLDG
ncbi:MAG: hypothetical protein MJA84_00680, partial [Firmicutes bacterium]|nr:hypothetical protein [Bacillota bacterium]